MPKPAGPRQPRTSRLELERLLDRTVLGPTHPELGTCWSFTGMTTPYGRIAKAQDSYTHRLGWKLLRAGRTASMGIRCPARTCESGQTGREPAGRVTQRTSGRSGNASVPARIWSRGHGGPLGDPP